LCRARVCSIYLLQALVRYANYGAHCAKKIHKLRAMAITSDRNEELRSKTGSFRELRVRDMQDYARPGGEPPKGGKVRIII
jgi:hypothetical protein